MYHHLLVPIDDTLLSAANVRASIQLAKCLGARMTFFHALKDWAATADGSVLLTIDPERFRETALGDSNSILLKAMASARGAEVLCGGASRVCDRPAEAIVEAAAALQCDLIVMASRGGGSGLSGWLHSSQTERVLRRAPVALLVTRVEAASPLRPSDRALSRIEDEHRSIAVVVQAMRDIAKELRSTGSPSDVHVLEALVQYLNEFPRRVHHPKEELHLHKWLRTRDREWARILDDVEAQHVREGELIDALSDALRRYQADASRAESLAGAIDALAQAVFDHMTLEEGQILPRAREVLTDSDWLEIADAFELNDDPRYGDLTADEFRSLFTRIANRLQSWRSAS
jgi:nucleotide-binding universal stress UspA family protein/hemerythrin-like domain-containing protein